MEDSEDLASFLQDFASIPERKILVHGGGTSVSEMSEKLGIEVKMVDGRRITDSDTLEVVKMMLAGVANKNIVAILQGYGCNALGMTGTDGNSILAHKRPMRDGMDYGYVGDIDHVNAESILNLLEMHFVPVFTALTHDGKGQLLNTNADTIAQAIGVSLSDFYQVEVFYCFEKKGVLTDLMDEDSLIKEITFSNYKSLQEKNIIMKGMIPKIDNAFESLNKGVSKVHICHFNDVGNLGRKNTDIGTIIKKG